MALNTSKVSKRLLDGIAQREGYDSIDAPGAREKLARLTPEQAFDLWLAWEYGDPYMGAAIRNWQRMLADAVEIAETEPTP